MGSALKLKKDDPVIVISGKYKGKTGTIVKSLPAQNKVVVSGVNVVKKHQKAGAEGAGGIVEKSLPIHVSNVAYADPKDGKACRVGYAIDNDGMKSRISRRTKEKLS